MALEGHERSQIPHDWHLFRSIKIFAFWILTSIALAGQTAAH